jgi:tripeptidyl-peptidase-1
VTNLSDCQDLITPACVKALYQVPPGTTAQAGNELGIEEYGDEYDQEDLNLFFTSYSSNIPNGTHLILQSINGGSAPVPTIDAGGESELDLQLSYLLIFHRVSKSSKPWMIIRQTTPTGSSTHFWMP